MLYLFVFATCNAASKIYVSGFPHVFTKCCIWEIQINIYAYAVYASGFGWICT